MKNFKTIAWMMATAIAGMTMTACSSDDYEPAKPFTTDPVELSTNSTLMASTLQQLIWLKKDTRCFSPRTTLSGLI